MFPPLRAAELKALGDSKSSASLSSSIACFATRQNRHVAALALLPWCGCVNVHQVIAQHPSSAEGRTDRPQPRLDPLDPPARHARSVAVVEERHHLSLEQGVQRTGVPGVLYSRVRRRLAVNRPAVASVEPFTPPPVEHAQVEA